MSLAIGAPGTPRRTLVVGLGALVTVALAAYVGYEIRLHPSQVVIIWPPAGIMLGALLVLDRQDWRAALVGGFLANVLVDGTHGAPFALAVTGSLANTVEEYVAALVVRRIAGPRVRMVSLREVGAVLFGAGLGSNAVTALLGATVLTSYYEPSFPHAWLTWWAGDGLGMLTLAPAVVCGVHWWETREDATRRGLVEHAAFVALATLVALFVLQRQDGAVVPGIESRAFLVVPVLIAAGLRLGPTGAVVSTLGVAAVTIGYALAGDLVVGTTAASRQVELLDVFTFLALAAVSSLVPAAVVADRARAIADLRRSEDRFRQIADNANEAFLIVDAATGQAVYASPSWGAMWGCARGATYDPVAVRDAIHPDDRARVDEAWRLTGAGSAAEVQFRLVRPDGADRWLRRRSFPVRDDAGAVVRAVFLVEDVTQLRETERRYVQAQKLEAVGRLASGVAHDFNNLLAVISVESQILHEAELREPLDASVSSILQATHSAATLTRQLLSFTRQQQPTTVVPIEVNAAVRDLARLFGHAVGDRVRIDVRPSAEPAWVRADRGQLEQVFANLVLNARDAMPEGGIALITVACVTVPTPVDRESGHVDAMPALGWVEISV
ncbi:MAG TPA: MASE1 domain-containing protein, partial [Gemmatimonadaceae bacterium]|nr:MASE1 domain-containing protein [Gemmatimonadaceae bacterium]